LKSKYSGLNSSKALGQSQRLLNIDLVAFIPSLKGQNIYQIPYLQPSAKRMKKGKDFFY
jgi:hypothetical protein